MQKIIITGHSRGLGKALTEHYLKQGKAVLGLSRQKINMPSENLQQHEIDLSDTAAQFKLLSDGIIEEFITHADEIILINNAGTVMPNAILGKQMPSEISQAVTLNITAPLLLSNHLAQVKASTALLKIIHISSGAGRKDYAGWNVYGATKAALDHHARCIANENHTNIQIHSIAPGVIDTEMQAQIRASQDSDFPLRDNFVALKETGKLLSPETTASKIAHLIQVAPADKIILDVRDAV